MTLKLKRRLGGHPFDEGRSGLDGVDESRGFAKPNRGIFWIALRKGPLIARALHDEMTLELLFSTMPAVRKCISPNPGRESGGPG